MSSQERSTGEVWTRRIAWGAAVVCLPLLLLDVPIHRDPEFHPHFAFEEWFGFYSGLSIIVCLSLVMVSKVWQPIVRRREEYYDE